MKEAEVIPFVSKLEKPTAAQKLLLLMHGKQDRSKLEQRQYDAMIKAELAARKSALAKDQVTHLLRKSAAGESKAKRKERERLVFNLGGLVMKAGLKDWDKGEILGGLMQIAGATAAQRLIMKRNGDAELAKPKPATTGASSSPPAATATA